MKFMNGMLFSQAEQLLRNSLAGITTEAEQTALSVGLGRVTAEDIIAYEDLPPFNRSTVDGFAVRSADLYVAGEGIPVVLDVIGEIQMGCPTEITLSAGQAVVIPTGGMLPAGADAVVMVEYTEKPDKETVLVMKPVAPGENVIIQGEDIQAGRIIIKKGEKITPAGIGALAACGVIEVPVRRRLRVAIISSGDEVADVATAPSVGQIRDINSYVLAAMMETMGCSVFRYGIVPDEYERILTVLRQAVSECDLVLISGGSSVGTRDYTVGAITALGNPGVLFHGIAVKPGKPTIYGLVGRVPIFGLPGHPVSAMTICEQLVKPVVDMLSGCFSQQAKRLVPARMTRSTASAPGRDDFVRVRLLWQKDGYAAEPILGKSGLISTMLGVDGIVHIEANSGGLYANDLVLVQLV